MCLWVASVANCVTHLNKVKDLPEIWFGIWKGEMRARFPIYLCPGYGLAVACLEQEELHANVPLNHPTAQPRDIRLVIPKTAETACRLCSKEKKAPFRATLRHADDPFFRLPDSTRKPRAHDYFMDLWMRCNPPIDATSEELIALGKGVAEAKALITAMDHGEVFWFHEDS